VRKGQLGSKIACCLVQDWSDELPVLRKLGAVRAMVALTIAFAQLSVRGVTSCPDGC
jgi:hypothetical protein